MSIHGPDYCSSNCSPLSKTATTTCASLLRELQEIWDEIGEGDAERDKMLLELEQECLDIYRRKVSKNRHNKAELQRRLAESEDEIAKIASALGENVSVPQYKKINCNLKNQISVISPILENLRQRKQERVKEISEIEFLIAGIRAEIAGNDPNLPSNGFQVDELDLTAKKVGDLKAHLQEIQSEKSLRLQKVNSHVSAIHGLSSVMSLDFMKIMAEVHPSFVDAVASHSKSISNETLARLTSKVDLLKQEKQQRLLKLLISNGHLIWTVVISTVQNLVIQQVQDLARTLIGLWSLMDMPLDEQRKFDNVTCLISSDANEISSPGSLSVDIIEQAEAEVERLNVLKAGKMKELIFRRQSELEEIWKAVHMDVDNDKARDILHSLVESGATDLSELLSNMDDRVAIAKEQARSRKDILDKVEKWRQASEEENWLEEYERDENRYSAGKGVHKNLKRAEKARILIGKIPSLVESLTVKVKAWELEKQMQFLYDKTPLLRTLEEFTICRQEKEEEKRRSREQKKLLDQLAAEKEAIFGSKPNVKKSVCHMSTSSNTIVGTPNSRRVGTPWARPKDRRESGRGVAIPINYVALQKEDR